MKRILIWLMLIVLTLLLTACHVDNDPWPTGESLAFVTPTPVIAQEPVQATIQEPLLTATPVPTGTPTEIPGGSEEPGING